MLLCCFHKVFNNPMLQSCPHAIKTYQIHTNFLDLFLLEYTSKPRATHNLAHSAKSGNQCVTELVTHRKLSLR